MMKRNQATFSSLLFIAMMIIAFLPQAVFAEGEETGAVQVPEKIENPYMAQDFCKLTDGNMLSLSEGMDDTTLTGESHGYGTLVKGPVSQLESGRVMILSDFDFTGNPVGRISLYGVAERGIVVEALVYLDDSTEPVCTFTLDNKSTKGGWNVGQAITRDVYEQGITGSHRVSVGFHIAGTNSDQQASILLRSIEFAEDPGIPTMYFNIDESRNTIDDMNNSGNHSVECYGSVDIKVPDGYISEYESSPMEDLSVDLDYIRGRGNSTWDLTKKPYKIKLASKKDLFGMGKNAHWVLLANRYDNSLLRNRMTYWLGNQLGMEFTPQCVPVDLVMNGVYYGSYLLCEQIRIGDARINIDELKPEDTTLSDITGGYLLAMMPNNKEDPRSIFKTKRGVEFINENPDFVEYVNEEQKDYIRGYIQETEEAVFGMDFKDAEGRSWQEYMDLNAAVNYWWVQEFSNNGDAYGTDSTYLYKKRNDKLLWGPLWDFDYVAWGDLQPIDDLEITGFKNTSMLWFDRLLADPAFTDALLDRWSVFNDLVTKIVEEGGILDQYYRQTLISQRYECEKYGYYTGDDNEEEIKNDHPYIDEIEQLRKWVSGRQTWVNDNLESLNSLTNSVTFIADDTVLDKVIVKENMRLIVPPEVPEKEGFIFEGWYTEPEGGDKFNIESYDIEENGDMTLYAHYVTEEEASRAESIYVRDRVVWKDITEEIYTPLFVTLPKDANDSRISWKSSDEDIASVDKKGVVTMHKPGKVYITGKLTSEASVEYELNIYDPEVTKLQDPESIEVESDEITIEMGSYGYNPFTLLPADIPLGSEISFECDNGDIVEVGSCGELYPMNPGTTRVTVADYECDIETSFEVTVLGEGEGESAGPIDAIDHAITVLLQMNSLIKKADYKKPSYAAYYAVYKNAMDRLKEGNVSAEEISELRHAVIMAQFSLEKKAANTMKVKAKTAKVKLSRLKRKAQTIKSGKAFIIKNEKGKLSFTKMSKGSSKRLTINRKTGKIKVRKGTKKGLYRIKVKVTATGDDNFRPLSKVVTVKVQVK